jgi:N-alpha-acetyl-L-2,4-diaminobutyrate deacetylase
LDDLSPNFFRQGRSPWLRFCFAKGEETMRSEPISILLENTQTHESLGLRGQRFVGKSRAGKQILVTGALHGDEPTSCAAIWYLADRLAENELDHTVTLLPAVNALAVQASSRCTPLEDADLNRSFPGRADGTLTERLAAALSRLLDEHDVLIDVHTAAWCVPFVIVDRVVDQVLFNAVHRWVRRTDWPVVQEMEEANARLRCLEKTWSAYAMSQGKPAVTVELAGYRTLDAPCARLAADRLAALLESLAELDRPVEPIEPPPIRFELHANASGLLEAILPPGHHVRRDQLFAVVRTPEGRIQEEIRSPVDGLLLAFTPIAAVHCGSYVATLAAPTFERGRQPSNSS